jgi:hypothetical protein
MDPGNVEWQWDLYVSYWRLADAGHDTVESFRKGLAVIEKLHAAGLLNPTRVQWIDITKQRIADAEAAAAGGGSTVAGGGDTASGGGQTGGNTRDSAGDVEVIDDNKSDNKSNK